jgi:hypothetical protein
MMKKIAVLAFCAALAGALSSCSDFEKKIIRRRKKPELPRPRFMMEPARMPNDEAYRLRYAYWKGWQAELIRDLAANPNRKKQVQDVLEAKRHLASLSKFVRDEKAPDFSPYIRKLDELTRPILQGSLSVTENARLIRRLEAHRFQVERNLSPKDMKPYYRENLPPIDLTVYEDEEEILLPSELSSQAKEAPPA